MFLTRVAVLFAVVGAATFAEARPRHRPPPRSIVLGPRVHVVVNPWQADWVPAARAGWVWMDGASLGTRWRPGHWRPAALRVGWLWVPGFWTRSVYVDGYWREEARQGQEWVDGYYDDDGIWIPGYWGPAVVHHEYQ